MQKTLLPLIFSGLLLGGCATGGDVAFTGPERKYEITQEQKTLTLDFASQERDLNDAMRQSLRQFLAGHQPQFGQSVQVGFNAAAADVKLAGERVKAVRDGITAMGYNSVIGGPGQGQREDQVIVTHNTPQVSIPGCPDWHKSAGYDFTNTVYSNFNCANASNLGQMVANPMDLVAPKAMSAPDAPGSGLALQRYRTDKVKELLKDTATKKDK